MIDHVETSIKYWPLIVFRILLLLLTNLVFYLLAHNPIQWVPHILFTVYWIYYELRIPVFKAMYKLEVRDDKIIFAYLLFGFACESTAKQDDVCTYIGPDWIAIMLKPNRLKRVLCIYTFVIGSDIIWPDEEFEKLKSLLMDHVSYEICPERIDIATWGARDKRKGIIFAIYLMFCILCVLIMIM